MWVGYSKGEPLPGPTSKPGAQPGKSASAEQCKRHDKTRWTTPKRGESLLWPKGRPGSLAWHRAEHGDDRREKEGREGSNDAKERRMMCDLDKIP